MNIKPIAKKILLVILLLIQTQISYGVEPLPKNLIGLTSKAGYALIKHRLTLPTLQLLEHFTTQKTTTYCGIASAVTILNASNIAKPVDQEHLPYHYFTQDNFFNENVKKIIGPEQVSKNGITLTQLNSALQTYGLKTEVIFANELENVEGFRKKLRQSLAANKFGIVNFLRSNLQQVGGGHHSLLSDYDSQSDRFLILDVARYKYPAFWVTAADLWQGINTIDKDANSYRGLILIAP